jgi:hypothetical protein
MMAAGEVGLLLTECRANDSAQPSVNDIGARSELSSTAIWGVNIAQGVSLRILGIHHQPRRWESPPFGDSQKLIHAAHGR